MVVIRKKRERKLVMRYPFMVGEDVVAAYPKYNRAEIPEIFEGIAEGANFGRASRGPIRGIERKHYCLALILRETHSLRGVVLRILRSRVRQLEVGCLLPDIRTFSAESNCRPLVARKHQHNKSNCGCCYYFSKHHCFLLEHALTAALIRAHCRVLHQNPVLSADNPPDP